MPRRKDSFARALADAEKRLVKAKTERAYAQSKLGQLANEIPQLERMIAALSGTEARVAPERTGAPTQSPPPNLSPEDLAKWYSNLDLSQVKSIIPERPAAPAPQSEAETLPEDFAIGKR